MVTGPWKLTENGISSTQLEGSQIRQNMLNLISMRGEACVASRMPYQKETLIEGVVGWFLFLIALRIALCPTPISSLGRHPKK